MLIFAICYDLLKHIFLLFSSKEIVVFHGAFLRKLSREFMEVIAYLTVLK
jgi:hypothetical protein